MDVLGPAALFGAIIMVVGSVEIAQYSGESIAQGFIHHRFAAAPPQEVAFGGGAESPDVPWALTPAGDHRAGADVHNPSHRCWARCAVRWMALTMAPTWAQLMHARYHWTCGWAAAPGGRAEQVEPSALFPITTPSARRRHPGQIRATIDVGNFRRTWRSSITSRVRWVGNRGQLGSAVQDSAPPHGPRRVGVMRARAKPCGLGLRGPLGLGLRPGIRREFAGLAWPSNWTIRFSKRAITACNSAMMAMRTSRSTVVRSTSVSMPCI